MHGMHCLMFNQYVQYDIFKWGVFRQLQSMAGSNNLFNYKSISLIKCLGGEVGTLTPNQYCIGRQEEKQK